MAPPRSSSRSVALTVAREVPARPARSALGDSNDPPAVALGDRPGEPEQPTGDPCLGPGEVGLHQLLVEAAHAFGEQLNEQPVDARVAGPEVVELVTAQRERLGGLQRDRRRCPLAGREEGQLADGLTRPQHREGRGAPQGVVM